MQRLGQAVVFPCMGSLNPVGLVLVPKGASLSVSNVNLMRGYEQKTSFVSPFMYDRVT